MTDSLPQPVIGFFTTISTMLSYGLMLVFGRVRDAWRQFFPRDKQNADGYAPIVTDFEDFFTRRMYRRINDCWDRPVAGCPGAWIDIVERNFMGYQKPMEYTGKILRCCNLGSYNYLGFGDPNSPTKPVVFQALDQLSVSTCSPRSALGTTILHRELETLIARFVGKETAMVFGMGFGTNATGIPSLVGKGGLIISDKVNHRSLVIGARSADATVKVFNHNDPEHLERVIRRAILDGQPKTHRPWKKILIVCEGIYSMEGEMAPLAEIVRIKKKYNCYLYVDEAHSIGAIGATGRGICENKGVNPNDIDILMGTFTKSFGAVGGYIAASKEIIGHLRRTSAGYQYSACISPPAVQQIIAAIKIISGEDGTDLGKTKLLALRDNANFFRQKLLALGCHVLGDWGSPIIPVMLYNPCKVCAFSRECLARGLAVVVVGFPASPLLLARSRLCISAAHTRADLEFALKVIEEVIDLIGARFGSPKLYAYPGEAKANGLPNGKHHGEVVVSNGNGTNSPGRRKKRQ